MLYILRHGQSLWNAENRFTGWKDIALSNKGIQEAIYVADIIKNSGIQVEHIFTSDLTRAKETGQIIKTNLQLYVPFESTSLLNERNYGDFSGMNKNEVKLEKGEDFVHTLRRSYTYKPENGES
jgi:2,3-bisphosphoglycerate-dependent phosphoglycerate mutase